jgi:hypothetical protein
MEEFNEVIFDLLKEEVEISEEEEAKLAEIYRLATKLVRLLEELESHELKESASLMLIKEIVGENKLLVGLASKMLQDMNFGFDDDERYVS